MTGLGSPLYILVYVYSGLFWMLPQPSLGLLGAHSQGLAAGVRPSLVPDPTASLDPQHMIVEQLLMLGFS